MPDQPLPELARSLRSLGAARDAATQAAHDAIFTPLIAARVRASRAQGSDVVHSIRGATLADQIEKGATVAAAAGTVHSAMARARSASARDVLEPLRRALVALDAGASAAVAAGPGSVEWDGWLGALKRAFAAADDSCGKLATVLADPPHDGKEPRWFGRQRG